MEPYYQDEYATIYHTRCEDVLSSLPSESFDAVVTDPPFGIGFLYSEVREVHNDPAAYWRWLSPVYEEMLRVLKPGGFVAVWQAQPYFRHLWDWFGEDIHIYCAAKNFVQLRKTPINYSYDPVVMRYKAGAEPLRPAKPRRSVDHFVANTAGIISDPTRLEKGHPCPRPLDAVEEVLKNFVLPGGSILDPFMGSGATLLAARRHGFRATGVEAEPAYCGIAVERLLRERVAQVPLTLETA